MHITRNIKPLQYYQTFIYYQINTYIADTHSTLVSVPKGKHLTSVPSSMPECMSESIGGWQH